MSDIVPLINAELTELEQTINNVLGPPIKLEKSAGIFGKQLLAVATEAAAIALLKAIQSTDPRLTDARTPLAHSHPLDQLTGSTAVGRAVLAATTEAAARTAIGAGTSSLTLGTTASTAKAGNYVPAWTEVTDKPSTFAPAAHTHAASQISDSTVTGRSVLTAADAAAARTAIGAGTSNLAVGTTAGTAKAGNYTPSSAEIIASLGYTPYSNSNPAGYTTAGYMNTAGNSATATKLATARSVSVGWSTSKSFDGSDNLTFPASEILPSYLRDYGMLISDWNTATTNGWYKAPPGSPNAPEATNWWFGEIIANSNSEIIQTVYNLATSAVTATAWRRSRAGGSWNAWYKLQLTQYEQDARYVRLAVAETITGKKTFEGSASNIWASQPVLVQTQGTKAGIGFHCAGGGNAISILFDSVSNTVDFVDLTGVINKHIRAGILHGFNEVITGYGQNDEIRYRFVNQNTNGYHFLDSTGVLGFYDATRSRVRWSSDTTGLFNIGGNLYVEGTASWQSDRRKKKDIKKIGFVLPKLMKLLVVGYRWKKSNVYDEGLIAQDVQKLFPLLVKENSIPKIDPVTKQKTAETVLGVDYGRLSIYILKALQELVYINTGILSSIIIYNLLGG